MNILHHGNWLPVGQLITKDGLPSNIYECPLCFALTREPLDHAYQQHPDRIPPRKVSP